MGNYFVKSKSDNGNDFSEINCSKAYTFPSKVEASDYLRHLKQERDINYKYTCLSKKKRKKMDTRYINLCQEITDLIYFINNNEFEVKGVPCDMIQERIDDLENRKKKCSEELKSTKGEDYFDRSTRERLHGLLKTYDNDIRDARKELYEQKIRDINKKTTTVHYIK